MTTMLSRNLSPHERGLIRRLFERGPIALFDEGLSEAEIASFLARPEVKDELTRLHQAFEEREVTSERVRFHAKMHLASLAPLAISVIAKGLQGDKEEIRDEHGNIIEPAEPGPSPHQISLAKDVLVMLGVHKDFEKDIQIEGDTIVDARSVQINVIGDVDALPPESRERVRESVEAVLRQVRDKFDEEFVPSSANVLTVEEPPPKKRKKKKRKKKRKKRD